MTTEELVKAIAEWCSAHGNVESRFLYPDPQHYVFTYGLFDFLSDKTGLPIGEWFNAAQERLAAKKAALRANEEK
jgi:hypothetical protein